MAFRATQITQDELLPSRTLTASFVIESNSHLSSGRGPIHRNCDQGIGVGGGPQSKVGMRSCPIPGQPPRWPLFSLHETCLQSGSEAVGTSVLTPRLALSPSSALDGGAGIPLLSLGPSSLWELPPLPSEALNATCLTLSSGHQAFCPHGAVTTAQPMWYRQQHHLGPSFA